MLATKVTVLGEYIRHHIKEEQKALAVRKEELVQAA
jgi:hypothetical protein